MVNKDILEMDSVMECVKTINNDRDSYPASFLSFVSADLRDPRFNASELIRRTGLSIRHTRFHTSYVIR
eukprot:357794-Chlamydomonas_euryale.AAC.1